MNELLINLRESKNISRKELANFLGISLSMVEKVERGVRRVSPDLAIKWGNKLGLKETQLYQYFFTYKPDNMCRSEAANILDAEVELAATLSKTG